MKTLSKKAKGLRLEKHISKRLRGVLGVYARNMPGSGSLSGLKGDILTELPIAIEAKNQERVRLWDFWKQTLSQVTDHKIPVLIISRNRNPAPLAVLDFEDLLFFMELAIQAGWVKISKKGKRRARRKTV